MVGVCTYGPDSHKALSEKGLGSGSHVPSKNAWPIIILPYSFVLIKVLIVRVFRFLKKIIKIVVHKVILIMTCSPNQILSTYKDNQKKKD